MVGASLTWRVRRTLSRGSYYYYYLVLSWQEKVWQCWEKRAKDHSINLSKLPIYFCLLMKEPALTFPLPTTPRPPPLPRIPNSWLLPIIANLPGWWVPFSGMHSPTVWTDSLSYFIKVLRTSLVVQRLKLHLQCRGVGSILFQGAKIPHASWVKKKTKT